MQLNRSIQKLHGEFPMEFLFRKMLFNNHQHIKLSTNVHFNDFDNLRDINVAPTAGARKILNLRKVLEPMRLQEYYSQQPTKEIGLNYAKSKLFLY